MNPEQCRNAHDLNQISLTLGTSVLTLRTSKLGRQDSISFLHGEVFGNHTCVGAKTGEKLYLSAKRAKVTGYGKVVKIRLDMMLDMEKFELDLTTTRAIFPCMGIEQYINRMEGINFITAEGLLFNDLKEAPATTCQRNSLVSQGRVAYFETQGDKNHKRQPGEYTGLNRPTPLSGVSTYRTVTRGEPSRIGLFQTKVCLKNLCIPQTFPEYTRNQSAAGTTLLPSAGIALKAKVRNTHNGAVDSVCGRLGHARTNWTGYMTHTTGKICP